MREKTIRSTHSRLFSSTSFPHSSHQAGLSVPLPCHIPLLARSLPNSDPTAKKPLSTHSLFYMLPSLEAHTFFKGGFRVLSGEMEESESQRCKSRPFPSADNLYSLSLDGKAGYNEVPNFCTIVRWDPFRGR